MQQHESHQPGTSSTVRAVVWDWNGTLLDDVEAGLATTNAMLAAHGRSVLAGADAYRRSFGFPIRDFYRRLGFEADDDFRAASADYVARFPGAVARARLNEGALEALDAVATRGITQVLISATVPERLVEQMAPHGLAGRFEQVLGITDPLEPSKEHIVAEWLRASAFRPGEVLMVGDTNHDEEIAEQLGTRFVRFTGGHQHPATHHHPRIARLTELLDHLAG